MTSSDARNQIDLFIRRALQDQKQVYLSPEEKLYSKKGKNGKV